MFDLFNYLLEVAADAIFPHKCGCGKWGSPICSECLGKANIVKTSLCPYCGKISDFGRICTNCRYKTKLTGLMVVGKHEGVLKDAVWRLKYASVKEISQILADLALDSYGDFLAEKRFVVTAIPVSKTRRKWRGYNQSELIAKRVAEKLGLEYAELLEKALETAPQVGLTRKERLLNISGSIRATSSATNKRVLVVDDVFTTGATLETAAKALRENGYREVWGLVITRD